MIAYAYATQSEKTVSGALTLLMHGLFLVLLVFGVAWQKRERPPMVAELWSNLPPPPAPKIEQPPPPKAEPEPPKPVAKPEPKPKPQPKADISLKEKKEKALKEKKELAEKKKKEEQARLEKLKQEAEAKRQREQEEALQKLAAERAAAQARTIDEFTRQIHDKIKSRIFNAGCLSLKNPEVQLQVILLPDGNVLGEPRVRKSSGAATCDTAVTRAVLLAQPLPLLKDPALFPRFRDLNLNFRPND